MDSILGISDRDGHGPDLGSNEWLRAVHRRLPDESGELTLNDIGTGAWFRHVDRVVFWLCRSPRKPDWVYRKNLPEQTWTLEVWEPEGTTPQERWYRLTVQGGEDGEDSVMHPYDGRIVGRWVTDLDDNGRMEMVLATQSFGTGAYGNVIVHESTDGHLREVGDNDWKMPGAGYMGHDRIDAGEDAVIRTFPLYHDGDSNSAPSGGRQLIRYCLRNGSLEEVERQQRE